MLAVCCMSLFIVSMDATVVNVALPSIGRELGSTISGLQWTIDAYTLVLASLLLLSGSTADRIGRRRTFQIGLALFSVGSLLCSLAPSVGWLVVFRMVQAVGGSMMNPVAMSIITATFDDAKERAKAVGVWGAVVGVSMGLGPLVGGALTDTVGWRAIFWINVPIGVAAIVLTALFVPESRSPKPRRLDPLGQGIVIVLLATLVGGLIEGPRLGWTSVGTLGLFVVAAAALVLLVVVEGRRQEPLIDVRFFRSIPFSSAVVTAVVAFGANGAFLFLNALYLQEVRGMTPFQAGLWTLPAAVATMLVSPLSGRLVASVGTRVPLVLAGVGILGAGLVLTTIDAHTPMLVLVAAFVLFGFGFGMVNAPITNTAVSGMPRAQAGSAAAVASTSRQTGVSLGVALAGTVTGASAVASVGADFAVATHAMWWIVVGIGAAIVVVGFVTSSAVARRSADRVAPLLDA
ncbi:DHA2 family efflux MFS transporter permease subunit [Curtobacterium sp. MCBA15_001]|uniref:DHA2 family efflux MFS transporter permease subunit n=1 Tax=Curtobacterium sp. MCBA15_001 TaxID=1898731 RepID=UPI0009F1C9AD|nr:DHA2 family efflux MFS transporter permease subunit [Curtobacterium sp. MCBA15_001]